MGSTVNRLAVVYCARGKSPRTIGKGVDRNRAAALIGRIIAEAHAKGETLDYVRIVPCRKRPGTRVLFELSRKRYDQHALVVWCNYFNRKLVEYGQR